MGSSSSRAGWRAGVIRPILLRGRQNSFRYGEVALEDALYVDGLQCAFEGWPMGNAAEFIADEFDPPTRADGRVRPA